jgi:hypothetical protein
MSDHDDEDRSLNTTFPVIYSTQMVILLAIDRVFFFFTHLQTEKSKGLSEFAGFSIRLVLVTIHIC